MTAFAGYPSALSWCEQNSEGPTGVLVFDMDYGDTFGLVFDPEDPSGFEDPEARVGLQVEY